MADKTGVARLHADRAGEKDDPAIDLGKANNYAHRLVTGEWRDDGGR